MTTPNRSGYLEFNHDWGKNRVRLTVVKIKNLKARHIGGFYIHDSIKAYSSGCIEVDAGVFAERRKFARSHKHEGIPKLVVNYATDSTFGGTWIRGKKLKERACSAI